MCEQVLALYSNAALRIKFPATLHVRVGGKLRPEERIVKGERAMFARDIEQGDWLRSSRSDY